MTTTTRAPSIALSPPKRGTPRWIWVLVVVLVVVVVGAIGLLGVSALNVFGAEPGPGVSYDPDNPRPQGARALAQIVDEHSGDLRQARGLDEFTDAPRPGSNTTVVVSSVGAFNPGTAQQFLDRVSEAHRVILIAPQDYALSLLGLPVRLEFGGAPTGVPARCTTGEIAPDDTITGGTLGYSTSAPGTTSCFTTGAASNVLYLPAAAGRPEIVVVSGDMLLNENLALRDNAGVTTRLFANADDILWYVPFVTDEVPSENEESDVPAAIGPLIVLAAFAVLALMLWRGRRFGALVTEPLPAVVKAIETTQARGRMYHKARADARSAAALRIHTLASLASYLGLPYDAGKATDELAIPGWESMVAHEETADPAVHAIITTVVSVTGRDLARVRVLLAGPLPTTDTGLVLFTSELTALEKEVRHTP
ncbi:DUF4350 domain-containing protein [Gordonia alkanivorans]|jgi:hypothetical protein|uniref:DUF4350 domain-containing protein n=1 Tax=Gordonia alkanivorans TaxID=84096 RepID=UPI0024478571|nr:DUF4350 domain-containing protein [Gordonia alkanivorans]MDH3006152.1 DUF4350 domain-containing protein [Gordonia alkanivorans]MDH3012786.1 DUF4350 domain-containing protein [Gordonia alkanivorans]MDH3015907.1 DUF4350 domain-containing protein [Gordonia alkanivorans]MDH3040589.1 DUF4350 domain-containing protein [Gordonia alkanivorans]MDH3051259.1 DUF4350 domain-containing protein [Gordonia alkanivorans]